MQTSHGAKLVSINSETCNYWNICLTGTELTLYNDCICHNCKSVVPRHIPDNQVKRFIERRNVHVARKTVSKRE